MISTNNKKKCFVINKFIYSVQIFTHDGRSEMTESTSVFYVMLYIRVAHAFQNDSN